MGYPAPGVAADAVVCRVSSRGPELLLVKRKFAPFKGDWAFPGGYVDVNEDPRAAAIRELFEETGLELRDVSKGSKEDKFGDEKDPTSEDEADEDDSEKTEEERMLERTAKLIAVNGSPTIDPRGHAISIVYALKLPLFLPTNAISSPKKARAFLDSLSGHDDAAEVDWIPLKDIQSGKVGMAFSHGETILGPWLEWWEREGKDGNGGEAWFVEV